MKEEIHVGRVGTQFFGRARSNTCRRVAPGFEFARRDFSNVWFWCCFSVTTLAAATGWAATLVDGGQAKAVIVIPAGQKSAAAGELQHYLEKASGAKLAIVAEDKLGQSKGVASRVFVGPCGVASRVVDLKKLQPEGFVIKTEANDLYIVGRDATDAGLPVEGTFYGVCEFLERFLGVRWLMAGPAGEVVPQQATIQVALADIRQEPLLWRRNIRNSKTTGHHDIILRILKDWGVPLSEWETVFSATNTRPWFEHQRFGGRVNMNFGHSYGGWWDKYHEKYPDIFALQPNGTRINSNTRERLCISNPTLWDLVAQDRIKQLREDPSLTAASISPNDGGGGNKFCCCPRCRAWDSPSAHEIYQKDPKVSQGPGEGPGIPLTDRYCRFYNEVAKRVKQEMPDRFLGCYAYSLYRTPPVVVDHLEDNVIVAYVGFSSYLSDEARKAGRDDWLRWAKVAKQLTLRPNLLSNGIGLPINYIHKLGEDLRFLADHGMRAAEFTPGIGNWGPHGLDYYVLAKLLWDPYREVDPIVDDYCRAAYGPGAEAMKDYYRRVEELTNHIAAKTSQHDVQYKRGHDYYKLTAYYTDPVLAELQACLDRASAALGSSDPAALARVGMVATGLQYAKQTRRLLMAAADVRTKKNTPAQFDKVKAEVLAYYRSLALSWAVAVDHDYFHIRRGMSLKSAPPESASKEEPLEP